MRRRDRRLRVVERGERRELGRPVDMDRDGSTVGDGEFDLASSPVPARKGEHDRRREDVDVVAAVRPRVARGEMGRDGKLDEGIGVALHRSTIGMAAQDLTGQARQATFAAASYTEG